MSALTWEKSSSKKRIAKCEDPPIWVSQLPTDIYLFKLMKTNEMQQGQNVKKINK